MNEFNALRELVRDTNPVTDASGVDDAELSHALFAIEQRWDAGLEVDLGRPRPRPVVILAIAAAAVFLLIGVPLLLSTDRESDVIAPSTTVATATTVATPTTVAAPTTTIGRVTTTTVSPPIVAPVPDISWRRVEVGGGFSRDVNGILEGDELYGAITVVGSDLIIFGAEGGNGEPRNAVWRSSDGGETWEEIDAGGLTKEVAWSSWLVAAAAPDGTFVVAGDDNDDSFVWVTTDFEKWRKSDSPDLGGPQFQAIYGITHIDNRFVAVGDDGMDAAVWTSPDGLEWSQVLDDDFSTELVGEASIYGITRGGPGLVSVGAAGAPASGGAADVTGEYHVGAIWVSSDGFEWDLLPFVDDPSGFGLTSVSHDLESGRLIAFGGDRWVSDDGYEWAWYDRTVPLGGPPPGASAAWIGDVAVAGGWDAAFSLWISGDAGITWHRVDPNHREFEGCTQVSDVVSFGDRFIAVGPTAESCWSDEWTAAVWIGTITE